MFVHRGKEHPRSLLRVEIFRFWVVDDNRTGRLFGHNFPILSQHATDSFGLEQTEQDVLMAHLGARRIPETVTASSVPLREQFLRSRLVVTIDAKFTTHLLVPIFCNRLRTLHAYSMQVQILGVFIVVEQLFGPVADFIANGDT